MNRLICFLFIATIGISCSKDSLSVVDFVRYVKNPDNGLITERKVGDFKFTLQYEPVDYLALRELRNDKITQENFESTKKQFGNSVYFDFVITTLDPQEDLLKGKDGDSIKFNQRLNYFSFDFNQKVFLVDGTDTLPCMLHHFERTFGISPENHISLAFENLKSTPIKNMEGNLTFVYYDELLNAGTITMQLDKKNLFVIPGLKI